ncbi:AMIN-like domain-containing (lipo)protein [Kribbella deserti]|uniref:AMIN-like domain-containing protein n=1 Tax=Kribbella deserti TaxID=1926257 RepID=A0ABV6QE02_9ACTN
MKSIHTVRRPIRTTIAVLAVAAVPAGAIAVPALAGSTGNASMTTASTTTASATTAVVAKCPTDWGSLPEVGRFHGAGVLANVRAGRHACFDRVVFDVKGKPSWLRAHYVKNVVTPGEGRIVPLRGGAKLEVILTVPSYDDAGRATYKPANRTELVNVSGYRTLRQLATAGSFEGETTIGIGVRARLPFRVFTIAGPGATSRIVLDVAHAW